MCGYVCVIFVFELGVMGKREKKGVDGRVFIDDCRCSISYGVKKVCR